MFASLLPLHQIKYRIARRPFDLAVVLLAQEVVAQRRHVRQRLQHHIAVVVVLDVVQANGAREVQGAVDGARRLARGAVQMANGVARKRRVQQVLDVVQRRICSQMRCYKNTFGTLFHLLTNDLIVVRQTVELEIVQIEEHVMRIGHGMRVRMGVGAATLEVLAAHQTGVHVDARQRHGAQFLEVKVEQIAIDRVQIGAEAVLAIEHGRRLDDGAIGVAGVDDGERQRVVVGDDGRRFAALGERFVCGKTADNG